MTNDVKILFKAGQKIKEVSTTPIHKTYTYIHTTPTYLLVKNDTPEKRYSDVKYMFIANFFQKINYVGLQH